MNRECLITGYSVTTAIRDEVARIYRETYKWDKERRINTESKLIHMCIANALNMSGINLKSVDRGRIGVVLGTSLGGMESYKEFMNSISSGIPQPNAFSNSLTCAPASVSSIYFGFRGPLITLSGSATVGMDAIETAMDMIGSGICDIVLSGLWHMPLKSSRHYHSDSCAMACIVVLESTLSVNNRINETGSVITLFPADMDNVNNNDTTGMSYFLSIIDRIALERTANSASLILARLCRRCVY